MESSGRVSSRVSGNYTQRPGVAVRRAKLLAKCATVVAALVAVAQSLPAYGQGPTDGHSATSADKTLLVPSLEEQLKQQRAIAAELTENVRQLQSELSQAHLARQATMGGLSDLRGKLQVLEQSSKDSAVYLELERARTQIAQEGLSAQLLKVEQLEARLAVERDWRKLAEPVSPRPEPVITGSVVKSPKVVPARPPRKPRVQLATGSESGKCLHHLMSGQVSWGAGRAWHKSNALALCNGTSAAGKTIGCFTTHLSSSHDWRGAITACRSQ